MIMRLAWRFIKRNGYTKSEALKRAWLNWRLLQAMRVEVVEFWYQKTDGTMRQAFGTLRADRIPATAGTKRPVENCQTYFDTEKEDWRCFRKCNLVRVGRVAVNF